MFKAFLVGRITLNMKKLLLKFVSLNLAFVFVFSPSVAFAKSGAKPQPVATKKTTVKKAKTKTTEEKVLATACKVAAHPQLVYLPNEMTDSCKQKKDKKKSEIVEADKRLDRAKFAVEKRVKQVKEAEKPKYQTPFDPIYIKAQGQFNVPWQILSAVHEIETGRSGDTYIASYAGAQGPMQFMPSTFYSYGVDGDGDGQARINDVDDAIFSAANYLAANGANRGDYINALFHYNHDYGYVNTVLYNARLLGLGA
jgi:membrane-bound lytic murein transglycosylase B